MGNGLSADQATRIEQPAILPVELLIAVVGQHGGIDLFGDAEDEAITSPDGAGWWRDKLVGVDGILELGELRGIDAMAERGVDDDGDQRLWVFAAVGRHRFVQLFEARYRAALSGQIRSVDDHVVWHSSASQAVPRTTTYDHRVFTTVFWDFGGVITSSPFDAFRRYELAKSLPLNFIRTVNSTNPDDNAWARLERNDIGPDEFDSEFADESAGLGHRVAGSDVLALLAGTVRPEIVAALDEVITNGFRTACLTNNVVSVSEDEPSTTSAHRDPEVAAIMGRFEVIVESSKVGSRKPELAFYRRACELMAVEPSEVIYLDDLGINLKPAAAMGMHTIKVVEPRAALQALGEATGLDLVRFATR